MSNMQPFLASKYQNYATSMTPTRLQEMRDHAERNPEEFWLEQSRRIHWHHKPTKGFCGSFKGNVSIKWYDDGALNASVCCIDRHLTTRGDQVALISHREGRPDAEQITYSMLHERVCRLANALTHMGVVAGDRVAICLPMISETVISMLACARIGAVHVVLFGGFSAEGIAERLTDSGAVLAITASEAKRGAKTVPFKHIMDEALLKCGQEGTVRSLLVVRTSDGAVPMLPGRDYDYHDFVDAFEPDFVPVVMPAEAPLFMLYTSGSTGKPKAVVHATGGYMVWAVYTMGLVYEQQQGDILWCTADVAWITGHTSVVYGPLANGGTTMISDSLPNFPTAGRWLDIIDQYKVTMFFTSPTAVRAMMADGDTVTQKHSLQTLRLLGVAGEPISSDVWLWYHNTIGRGKCPVVDTWWQTETGGIVLGPVPGVQHLKPASASTPLPGLDLRIADAKGQILNSAAEGSLCIARSWPGQARTIWGDHERFCKTYFSIVPGYYFTGDGAKRDQDGYYWVTGRIDDIINVAGHRLGTAEVEDVLATDHRLVESAAVAVPHSVKGQGLVVFAIINHDAVSKPTEKSIKLLVSDAMGRYAAPETVYFVPDLPRTRSGKIVRRLLRKIASGEVENFGDLSTLVNQDVIKNICNIVQDSKNLGSPITLSA